MTPQQAEKLAALRPDTAAAWLLIRPNGTFCVMLDDTESNNRAGDAHAIRVALAPLLPPTPACPP